MVGIKACWSFALSRPTAVLDELVAMGTQLRSWNNTEAMSSRKPVDHYEFENCDSVLPSKAMLLMEHLAIIGCHAMQHVSEPQYGAPVSIWITDVMKSIGKVLGPIAKEVGPMVMKEFLMPMLKSKMGGSGLGLPGGALRLAGQGKKRRKVITKTRTKTIYR